VTGLLDTASIVGAVFDDRYQILREIGRGGCGAVYAALDRKLSREVAVKVVLASAGHPDTALRRLEQEAVAAGSIDHPHVLAIHDAGRYRGVAYVVSELLRGATLRERLQHGPLPLRDALTQGLALARGLAAAHAKGVVHRDLKPENVFLTQDGWLKRLDFGIAKLLEPAGTGTLSAETPPQVQLTRSGAFVGTVGYASPEQIRSAPVDVRSDVFSFGAVFYEMLCGQRAFRRASAAETGYAIVHDEPPPLPDAVPPAARAIAERCLRKNPAERFDSGADVVDAIHSAFADLGYTDPSTTPRPGALRPVRHSLVKGALLGAAVIAAIWLGLRLFHHSPPERLDPFSQRMIRLAAEQTRSKAALAAFEEGEAALRKGKRREATAAYQEALQRDPDFVLAQYRLALSSSGEEPGLSTDALQRALINSSRLPQRERSLLEAMFALTQGRSGEAEAIYRGLVARQDDDPEAWRQLGDTLFHYNPLHGKSALEATTPLSRALLFDPSDTTALMHAIDLELMQRNLPLLRALLDRYLERADPEAAPALPYRWLKAWAAGDAAAQQRVEQQLATSSDLHAQQSAWLRALWVDDRFQAAEQLGAAFAAVAETPRRALWISAQAMIEFGRGRPQVARALLDQSHQLYESPPKAWQTYWTETFDFVQVPPERLAKARREIDSFDVSKVPMLVPCKAYVVGALAVRAGDLAAAEKAAKELDAMPRFDDSSVGTDMALAVRARIAAARGQHKEALALLERQELRVPYRHAGFFFWLPEHRLRADLLTRVGRQAEAAGWHVLAFNNPFNVPLFAPVYTELSRIAEKQGDLKTAREHAARVAALLANCEPDLRHLLDEATARVRRLQPDLQADAGRPRGAEAHHHPLASQIAPERLGGRLRHLGRQPRHALVVARQGLQRGLEARPGLAQRISARQSLRVEVVHVPVGPRPRPRLRRAVREQVERLRANQ
jgi:serine/threonine protein kinase/tetratricopeptide (TPR) repeat protein